MSNPPNNPLPLEPHPPNHTTSSQPTPALSYPPHLDKATQFPLFALPPEIRNKIYLWTFILSRFRRPEYNIPDFLVHADGVRWMNVASFSLFLVSKQVFLEALPLVSAEAYMEIKVYTDESLRRRERKAVRAYASLLRTVALCGDVGRVVLNVTPGDWEIDFREDEQLPRLAGVLKDYPKLKEVTLKVRPESLPHENDWEMFRGFFELCQKGVSVCFELLDYDFDGEESDDEREEIEEQRKFAEEHVEALARDWAGKGASNVWVEWNISPEINEYR